MGARLGEALVFLKGDDKGLKSALADARKQTNQWAQDVGKGLATSGKGPASSLKAITAEWQKTGKASQASVASTVASLKTMQAALSQRGNVNFLASIGKQWEEGGNVSVAQLRKAVKAAEALAPEGKKVGEKIGRETGGGLKSSLTRATSGLAGIVSGALRGLGQIGLAGLGVQTLERTFRSIGEQIGIGLNVEMENVEAQLMAFTKSAPAAKAILAEIRAEADKTPFAFTEMAKATAGLLPSARQSGEALMDLVRIAEILAASNPAQGLEGAAFSLREAVSGDFVSIIERFNLPRQYLNQLKEEGVPAIEAVRRAMTSIGYDADLVGNLAKTASGKWSTFTDTLDGIRRRFGERAFGVGKDWLDGLQQALNENIDTINEWADTLGRGLARVMEEVPRMVGEWRRSWDEMSDEAKKQIAIVAGLLLAGGPLMQALGVSMQGVLLLGATFLALPTFAQKGIALATAALLGGYQAMRTFGAQTYEEYLQAQYTLGNEYTMTREQFEQASEDAQKIAQDIEGIPNAAIKAAQDMAGGVFANVLGPLEEQSRRILALFQVRPRTWQEEVSEEIATLRESSNAANSWASQVQTGLGKVTTAAQQVKTAFEQMMGVLDARIAALDIKRVEAELQRLLSRRAPASDRGRDAYERAVLEKQRELLGLQNTIYQASDQYAAQTGQTAPQIVMPTGNSVTVQGNLVSLTGVSVTGEADEQRWAVRIGDEVSKRLAEILAAGGSPAGRAAVALPGAG